MAKRPVFIAEETYPFVHEQLVDFEFYSGFAISRAQKSIRSLHDAFKISHSQCEILEVSSKSTELLGNRLSAFNLPYHLDRGDCRPLESVFQSSKVFADGEQFADLLDASPQDAKKDSRLREHGSIIGFKLEGNEFSNEPATFFYDWIYCNAVYQNRELSQAIRQYDAFTDIAFNPQKSLNCQARSAARFVGLSKAGLLKTVLSSKEDFLRIVYRSNDTHCVSYQLRMEF